jgi:hypothetical protein
VAFVAAPHLSSLRARAGVAADDAENSAGGRGDALARVGRDLPQAPRDVEHQLAGRAVDRDQQTTVSEERVQRGNSRSSTDVLPDLSSAKPAGGTS